jgi:hypothetical protein
MVGPLPHDDRETISPRARPRKVSACGTPTARSISTSREASRSPLWAQPSQGRGHHARAGGHAPARLELFHIPQQTHLAKLLCEHSFADRVFFSNSGTEANETAIKLTRKWAKEHGASDRGDIITMRGGFHGRTLATVTATAQEKYHHGYEPLPGGFKYVPFNDLRASSAGHRQPDGRRARGADPG